MSSNNFKIIIFFLFSIVFSGCAINSANITKQEYQGKNDTLILMALDSEKRADFKQSLYYYKLLYEKTSRKDYLKKALLYSYKIKDFKLMQDLSLDGIKHFIKEKNYFKQQYIISLIMQKKFSLALKSAKELLKTDGSAKNYSLVANIFYNLKQYQKSVQYYESAYAKAQTIKTLLNLTDILYNYLNKKDIALAYLETYLQKNGCEKNICRKLMLIYQEQGNVDGMLNIVTRLYKKYKSNQFLEKNIASIKVLIISLLSHKSDLEAIKYLEKTHLDNKLLISLYYKTKQLEKALILTKQLYRKTHNPQLLGQIAMFRFELAKDKRKVLKNVIANFELALSSGINIPQYQNYYGYLLIDYNINIKKGISLVKEALKSMPKNIAYIDSLAWGYYKLHNCTKAYSLMKQVINSVGLTDKEVKFHWEKINRCKRIVK